MRGIHPARLRLLTLLASAVLLSASGLAQVLFSSGPYAQAFNALALSGTANPWSDNSTLLGWYAAKAVAPTSITAYNASAGTATAGALYSFGSALSSERALGTLPSGGPGNLAFGIRFVNDTAQPITDIAISYTGEEWRSANTSAQSLAFSYRVGSNLTEPDIANVNTWNSVPALSFTSPVNSGAGALDGNNPANRHVFSSVPLSGVQVTPGQEIFFRWYGAKAASGSSDGLGIDDLTITFKGPSSITNPPTLSDLGQPVSRTNNAGTTATFTVSPDGTPPFTYRWWKDTQPLSDGANVSGAGTATLTLTNVLAAQAGSYFVGVTNGAGGTASTVAVLTVNDPAVLSQSGSRTCFSGDTAIVSVAAAGTPPLSFQWYKDGMALAEGDRVSGAQTSTLRLAGLASTDAGSYQVTVSNGRGTVTSKPAVLTLHLVPSARIALWTFNDTSASLASPAAALGNGSASLLNGVTATWAAGSSLDSDLVNEAWNTAGYPALSDSNKTAGVQFKVSTLGYTNILLAWEQRHSNTGSKYARLQYSADGVTFTDLDVISATGSFAYYSHDFAGLQAVENNPNFAFRIVSEFESTAVGSANNYYVPLSGTNYGSSGTLRFDVVSVFGEPIASVSPIPLQIQQVGGDVVLRWSDPGFALQSAPTPRPGLFTNVPGAASPYTTPLGSLPRFFRLKH